MATTNGFTTALGFWKYLNLARIIPSAGNENYEEVGVGNNSKTTFFLDHIGVIESTYSFYYGDTVDSVSALTETTDYTIDLETGKITLTAGGLTKVGTKKIFAAYSFNAVEMPNSEALIAINYAENKILRETEQFFTDNFSSTSAPYPKYHQMSNERLEGRYDIRYKTFGLYYQPIVNIDTTVATDFTLGGTSLTLTSAVGLPASGTINAGGNKVAYTARNGNILTVPNTTPTIAAGSRVTGEVVEISKEVEGNMPSFVVLNRDTDYKIDFMQGRIEPLGNAYFGQYASSRIYYPANYMIQACYISAWYDKEGTPRIPEDIKECIHMIAARRLVGRITAKAHTSGLNDFNPNILETDKEEIDEILYEYKTLNVGTSPFNRQSIS